MTYYAQRKSVLNGEPQAVTNKYGTHRAMERAVCLHSTKLNDNLIYKLQPRIKRV